MITAEVIHTEANGLARRVWRFQYFEYVGLALDYYGEERRESTRRKWAAVRRYDRLLPSLGRGLERISEQDAPLPSDVVEAARADFVSKLKVVKWNNR